MRPWTEGGRPGASGRRSPPEHRLLPGHLAAAAALRPGFIPGKLREPCRAARRLQLHGAAPFALRDREWDRATRPPRIVPDCGQGQPPERPQRPGSSRAEPSRAAPAAPRPERSAAGS